MAKLKWQPKLCKRCDDYILTKEDCYKLGSNFFHLTCPFGGTFEDLLRKMVGEGM